MKFTAELSQFGNNTGIEVPPDVLNTLGGGKRPRVKIALNGFSFSLTLGAMNGKTMIPVSAERRKLGDLVGGNTYEVTIELDNAPQLIAVPDDFATALAQAGLRDAFDRLAPSHRKEHVRAIEAAKAETTRQRRIDKAIEMIAEKAGKSGKP